MADTIHPPLTSVLRAAALSLAALAIQASPGGAKTVEATPAFVAKVMKESRFDVKGVFRNREFVEIEARWRNSNFSVLFFDCPTREPCRAMQFETGYDLPDGTDAERMNRWNRDWPFGKAFVDQDNDPWLEMDVSIHGGVTRDSLANSLSIWSALIEEFEDYIGW